MRRWMLPLAALLVLIPLLAAAQGRGFYIRSDCTVITSPVTGYTWCFDSTTNQVKVWNGTVFVNVPVESYTKAGLPAAGTAGRLARVTDDVRGIFRDGGTTLGWDKIPTEIVSADDFMVGDGVTDDATAFGLALDAAAGKMLVLGPKTYKINSAITKTGLNVVIVGQGIGKTILDFSAVVATPAFELTGTLTALAGTLSGAVAKDAQTFVVSSATGISARDWLLVRPTFVGTGTVVATLGSAVVTGTGTAFTTDFANGDTVIINGATHGISKGIYTISTVDSATQITLTSNWLPATVSGASIYKADDKWNSARSYYYKGEWLKVESVSGTTITPEHVMYDSYRSGTPLSRLDPIRVGLFDVEIKGNANIKGVRIQNALSPVVERVKISGMRESGLDFTNVVGGRIRGYENEDTWYSGTGTSYGFVGVTVHDLEIMGSSITDGRHAIAIGAGTAGGVNRHVSVHDNFLRSEQNHALDAHGITEYVNYESNVIVGGIVDAAYNARIANNLVFALKTGGSGLTGIAYSVGSDRVGNAVEIVGNTFVGTAAIGTTNGLVFFAPTRVDKANSSFVFERNTLILPSPFTGPLFYFDETGTVSDTLLSFAGNRLSYLTGQGASVAGSNGQVFIRKVAGDWRTVVIRDNYLSSSHVDLRGAITTALVVQGNTVLTPNASGLSVTQNTATNGLQGSGMISGNVVSGGLAAGLQLTGDVAAAARVRISNNSFINNGKDTATTASTRSGLLLQTLAEARVYGNDLYDNQGTPTQLRGYNILSTVARAFVRDNRTDGNVTSVGDNLATTTVLAVASAAALTLPDGDVVSVTGTTNITSVTATGQAGRRVVLVFADVLTFTDGSNLKLAGNFATTADDTITIVCDGTNWFEVARSAN